jgi:AraC-like DNA-binding protein
MDEQLVPLLNFLIKQGASELKKASRVNAVKTSTQKEIYSRVCIAKDVLQSSFMKKIDLPLLSQLSCLSVPQLVRQFKCVFKLTPHQYLMKVRLARAVEMVRSTDYPVNEIALKCGFEDTSAFCRAFRLAYGTQPTFFRN